jgi:hypothetical protein
MKKNVFNKKIFFHFSKIPTSIDENKDENKDKDKYNPGLITPEQEALDKPLYERLVNHEKVALVVSGSKSVNNSAIHKRALKHIMQINSKVSVSFSH